MNVAKDGEDRPGGEESSPGTESDDLAWLRRLGKERDEKREARRRTEAMTVRFTKQDARRLREQAETLDISAPRYVETLCTYRDPSIAARAQDLVSEMQAAADDLEDMLTEALPEPPPSDAAYDQMRGRVAGIQRRAQELAELYEAANNAEGTE